MDDSFNLEQFDLFDGFSQEDKNRIKTLCQRQEVAKDQIIIEQGSDGHDLFLIESGCFDVIHYEHDHVYVLNQVHQGDTVGLTAMISGSKRTASVKASEPSVVYKLSVLDLETIFGKLENSPYITILHNQLIHTSKILSHANDNIVSSLKHELNEAKKRLGFSNFVAILIGSVTAYAFLLRIFLEAMNEVDSVWISVSVLLMGLGFYVPMMKKSGIPWSVYGFNLHEWRSCLVQSLKWTFTFILLLTGAKWILIQVIPSWNQESLFSLYGFVKYDSYFYAFLLMGIYCLFAPIQEVVVRGAMQSSLQEFLPGKHPTFWAIILSTLMFSQLHLHVTPAFAVTAAIPSIFWGTLYAKQRSLFGVSISHIIIGIYTVFILGFPVLNFN